MDPILRKADPIIIEGLEIQTYVDINQNVCYYHGISVARFLNMSNIRTSTINKLYRQLLKVETNGGIQKVMFLTVEGVKQLVAKSRSVNASVLAKHFGQDVIDIYCPSKEASSLEKIMTAFNGEKMLTQYAVDKYRIDLYFEEYKLAIECDEDFHRNQVVEDEEREHIIKNTLGCTFIRFHPDDKEFNMYKVINQIYSHIMSNLKS